MKALCYLPYSYDYIRVKGIKYLECEIVDNIAFFPKNERGFYCKTVGEIKQGKEIYIYQKYL